MKIDKLPVRLIISSIGLYLTAIVLFIMLAYYYRPEVPISKDVTLVEAEANGRVLLQATINFTEGEEITFKYFDHGVPRYQRITSVTKQKNTVDKYLGKLTEAEPKGRTYPVNGFVHVPEPIKKPLLSFLLE